MASQSQSSVTVSLDAGTHWICTCGQSQNYPYCDGSHKGTTFQPLALELQAPKVVEISR
jgi:CDGSH-type Zn-finger protein